MASIRHAVEQLGAEHVLFGSDYPIHDSFLVRAVELLNAAGFDAETRRRIGWANAEQLFGLA